MFRFCPALRKVHQCLCFYTRTLENWEAIFKMFFLCFPVQVKVFCSDVNIAQLVGWIFLIIASTLRQSSNQSYAKISLASYNFLIACSCERNLKIELIFVGYFDGVCHIRSRLFPYVYLQIG